MLSAAGAVFPCGSLGNQLPPYRALCAESGESIVPGLTYDRDPGRIHGYSKPPCGRLPQIGDIGLLCRRLHVPRVASPVVDIKFAADFLSDARFLNASGFRFVYAEIRRVRFRT